MPLGTRTMYRKILSLLALNEESTPVLQRAHQMATQLDAQLYLLHVVEYVPLTGTEDAMLTAPVSIGEELEERARTQLRDIAQRHGIPQENCCVVSGDLVSELCRSVSHWQADLVVVGNHSRRGLSALFDHAEDAVLHRCPCDLLAVHLG